MGREKPVKDLHRDWPKLRAMMGEDENWCWEKAFADRDRIGELGVYSVAIGIPQDWWFFQRDGGYNVMFYDYADDPGYIQEMFDFYNRYALAAWKPPAWPARTRSCWEDRPPA